MIIVFNHKCAHLSFSFQYHLIHRGHPRLWHLVYRSDCSNKVFCCSREKGYQGIIDAPWVEGTTLGTVRVSDSFCVINTLNFHELSLRQYHWRLKLSRFHFAHLLLLSSSFRLWPACQAADSWHQRRFQSLVKLFGTDEPSIHIKEFEKHGKSKAKRNGDLTVVTHFLRCFWILTEIFRTSPLGRQWKYIHSWHFMSTSETSLKRKRSAFSWLRKLRTFPITW